MSDNFISDIFFVLLFRLQRADIKRKV